MAVVIAAIIGALGYQSLATHAPAEADGVVPDGVTVFDDEFPAVTHLDPDLLGALRQAATDADGEGIEFYVTAAGVPRVPGSAASRGPLRVQVRRGSSSVGCHSGTSPHVSGDAVDIGPSDAAAWLSEHGALYGLCQIYRNESLALRAAPRSIDHGCPPMYVDPTQDPRMQQ
jgi:hypothetical protein